MPDIGHPDDVTRSALLLVAGEAQAGLAPIVELLRGAGYRIALAESAAVPPGVDGREFTALLRQDAATRDIPVIFLVPAAEAGAEVRAFRDGAADCVACPPRPEVLLARVRSQLLAGMTLELLRGRAVKPAASAGDDQPTVAGEDAMPFADAVEIITAGCGRQFDPAVTRAFIEAFDEFVEVAARSAEPHR